MTAQKQFKDLVAKTVEALKTNSFALEKQHGLPADASRGRMRKKEGMRKEAGTSLNRAKQICDALGLEFYIGPPREITPAPHIARDDDDFNGVELHNAEVAGGAGVWNLDDSEPIDTLAFSKKWLRKNNINAGSCVAVTVKGRSMEPSIYDGDIVVIDQSKRAILRNRIYAFVDGDNGARVKRLEPITEQKLLLLHSDNPDQDKYPTEYRLGDDADRITHRDIIGQVVWSGHRW